MAIMEGKTLKLSSHSKCWIRNDCKHLTDSSKKHICNNSNEATMNTQGMIEIIKEKFGKVRLSVSSYDTAWVAMAPSKNATNQPLFPECLDWILKNQQKDGSWGLLHSNYQSDLLKDSLSSTLACVLALQQWHVGEQLVNRGLDFIGSNNLAMHDKSICSPIGFDLVFPNMINQAQKMGLNLLLDSDTMDLMLRNRDLQLTSFRGNRSSLAYIAEGLGESYNWGAAISKYQRRNGSLFNSPATTAAALSHINNDKCYKYLDSLLKICGNAVPTMYPFDLYTRLCLIDTLENLGIDRYFRTEITTVLDETYRSWLQQSEDIFLDIACHATAFRLLRMNGYDIQSDTLAEFVDQEQFFSKADMQFTDTSTILELYRASQIQIFEEEPTLGKINNWTSIFLKTQLLNGDICYKRLMKKVENELRHSRNVSLDRLSNRRNIELYHPDEYRMYKTSYWSNNVHDMDILKFSVQDFNNCQTIHRKELHGLERWAKEWRLDSLKLNQHTLVSSYFQVAAVFYAPELADARLAWGKNSTFGTIIDDLFDIDGSKEELLNIIDLVQKWDARESICFCSKRIEILFSILEDTVNEFSDKALIQQGRCIRDELIQMWLIFLQSMLREVDWWKYNTTPSLDEYSRNGSETIGVGLFVNSSYFVGSKLSLEILKSEEFVTLYHLAGKNGRLLNDYQSYERENDQRKLNGCQIVAKESKDTITYEESRKVVWKIVEASKREALRMKIQEKGSIVPKQIKDSIWKSIQIIHYLYSKGDEYRRPGITKEDIKAVLYEPIPLPTEKIS